MPTPLRVLPPAAAFVGRVTAAAVAAASGPVHRGSVRNAQAAIAMNRANGDGPLPLSVRTNLGRPAGS
jgi:hypothetical protein